MHGQRNVKTAVEKIKTHILCPITFYPQNHTVYEIMWKNVVELDWSHMAV